MNRELLSRSYKRLFPFTLGTTSYIFPDSIVPNVRALAPFLDEIELVLYESRGEDNLPSQAELQALIKLSYENHITYNVHLPIDVFLGDKDPGIRSSGVSVIRRVIELTSCLVPSGYTLHFELGRETDLKRWQKCVMMSAEEILKCGLSPERISIETLGYPFEFVEDIVRKYHFSICLDIGHILISDRDLEAHFDRYLPGTSVIHLHGFQDGVDHLGIDRLPGSTLTEIVSRLAGYHGLLSLEIFSIGDLRSSLALLEETWLNR
jgi:sugar phosphate isomerase/epimerase